MQTSLFIASLIGPILVVAGIAMLANPSDLEKMGHAFLDSRPLIYLTGIMAMLGGLAIINTHNLWVADWPVILTFFGWAMAIGGAVRIALPATVKSIGTAMLGNRAMARTAVRADYGVKRR